MGGGSGFWIEQWHVMIVAQVRAGMRCKETGWNNRTACHNSVAKGELLSLTASGQTWQIQEFQSVVITGVPTSCDYLCCKLLDRFKFVGIEGIVRVP